MVGLTGPAETLLPAVTVIILASSDAIGSTLESVQGQDYPNFNCIIVEDEPITDFAHAIARYLAEWAARIRILPRIIPILGDADSSWHRGQTTRCTGNYLNPNDNFAFDRCTVASLEESAPQRVGISACDCDSLDDAWRQATSRYVAIVCSGDGFRTNWLSVSVALMEANPETIVGYPDWVLIDAQNNVLDENRVPDYDFRRMVLDPRCIPGPGVLIRRSAVSMPRLRNQSFHLTHGYEIWLLLGLQGDFIHIPGTMALRQDDASRLRERFAEYRRAKVSFFGQAGLPKIVESWHSERVDVAFDWAMRIAPESARTAMRVLFLALLVSPLATLRKLLSILANVAFVRAMTVVPKSPLVAMGLLCLAFVFNPFATLRKLLPILAKYSGKLTRLGIPAPVCEWIGYVAERSVSSLRKSQ
jgi:glycosyltransferase involved in cell wall biosynthesis